MKKINWGIIGCGDVTEIKSGPAFNKVNNSSLVAVMRRDAEKAKDYARRHKVPAWYNDANKLINDPNVNAIYIATPPSSHEAYAIAAIDAGKPVYVEKPMTLNQEAAIRMAQYASAKNVQLCVAHYRRAQPLFKQIKLLLDSTAIGQIHCVRLDYFKKHDHFAEEDFLQDVFQHSEVIDNFTRFKDKYANENHVVLDNEFDISNQAVKKQAKVFKSILKLDRNFHVYIHGSKDLIEKGIEADGRKYYKLFYEEEE
jgi:hypothetical protein